MEPDGRGDDVNALVHSGASRDLSSEDPAPVRGEEQLDEHVGGSRVIACVASSRDDHGLIVPALQKALFHESLLGASCGGRGETEHLRGRGALRALVALMPAERDVIGGNPALFVRRPRERYAGLLPRDEVRYLNDVACRVDVRIGGDQLRGDRDAAGLPDLKPCVPRDGGVRPHADGKDREIRLHRPSA